MINPEDAAALGQETSALYAQAELLIIAAITEHIATVGDVPNFVWLEQLRRAQLRGYVQGVANVLAQKSNTAVSAAVVEAVELGQKAAVSELASLGKAAPKLHDSGLLTLAEHHSRGVSTELNRMVAGLGNSTNDVMRRISANAAADVARGDLSPFDAARKAHTRMAREGYGFFRDTNGRKWGMDTYAEMAVRSGANNAMIEGHTRALTAAGEDFVIVSSHSNPAPQCAPYERKVLSLTGAHRAGSHRVGDSIVSVKATLNEARANGFEHPNAILGGSQLIDTFAGSVGASKCSYRGPAITIRTAKGHSTTVSPEHPVLTRAGWRTAKSLRASDYVFSPRPAAAVEPGIGTHTQINHMPSTVENEFVTLKSVGSSRLIPSAGHDFNDDRKFLQGEINVVITDDCLLPVPDAHVIKETGEVDFMGANMSGVGEIGHRSEPLGAISVDLPFAVAGALTNCDSSSLKPAPNGYIGGIENGRDLLAGHSTFVHGYDLVGVQPDSGSEVVSKFSEVVADGRVGDSQDPGTVALGTPFGIEADQVVSVECVEFSGQAYDFQTVSGVYSVNSIILHNCRHTISVYQPGTTPRETPKQDPNHEGYKATQKQRYYEREIRASKRMEEAALTDADKTAARSRTRAYQGKLRDHVKEYDLQRRRHREQVRTADWED